MIRNAIVVSVAIILGATLTLATGTTALAQDRGGIVNWFIYADPARFDIHTETPLGVQQATAGVYSGLLQYDPDDPKEIRHELEGLPGQQGLYLQIAPGREMARRQALQLGRRHCHLRPHFESGHENAALRIAAEAHRGRR